MTFSPLQHGLHGGVYHAKLFGIALSQKPIRFPEFFLSVALLREKQIVQGQVDGPDDPVKHIDGRLPMLALDMFHVGGRIGWSTVVLRTWPPDL